ncbi:hypothetical protein TNCV_2615601 [Trichonephila clavipes]|nr:hypothetical protein TNCV_2615601 [Trichonephila clavipes]
MNPVILNRAQVMKITLKLAPYLPDFYTTPVCELQASTNLTCISFSTWMIFSDIRTRIYDRIEEIPAMSW